MVVGTSFRPTQEVELYDVMMRSTAAEAGAAALADIARAVAPVDIAGS